MKRDPSKAPRSAGALTAARRAHIAQGVGAECRPAPSFLRALRRFDPGLEAMFVEKSQRWALYRVARRGVVPAEDWMVLEFEAKGPKGQYRELGPWVLDRLRLLDKTQGGSVDPRLGDRAFMRHMDENQYAIHRERERKRRDLSRSAAWDVFNYAVANRRHFGQGSNYLKVRARREHGSRV